MADMLEQQHELSPSLKEEEIERNFIRLLRKRGRKNKTRLTKALVAGLGKEEYQEVCEKLLLNKDLDGKTVAKELCEVGLKDPDTREISIQILISLRGDALRSVTNALGDPDPVVVNSAKEILIKIGSISAASVVTSLEHENSRKAATEVLITLSNSCISTVCFELLTHLKIPKLRIPIFQIFSILGEQALPELHLWLDIDKFDRSSLICVIEKLIREERNAKELTRAQLHMRPHDSVDRVQQSTERSFPTPILDTALKVTDFSPLNPSKNSEKPCKPQARLSLEPNSPTWKHDSSIKFSQDSRPPLHFMYDESVVPKITRWSPHVRK